MRELKGDCWGGESSEEGGAKEGKGFEGGFWDEGGLGRDVEFEGRGFEWWWSNAERMVGFFGFGSFGN